MNALPLWVIRIVSPHTCRLLAVSLFSEIDESGVYGLILHYAMVFAIVGTSLLTFLYFWSKGRLDMDEEPKLQMMQEQEEELHGKQAS